MKPLAEQGDLVAISGIARMYAEGLGVPVDMELAVDFFRKAARFQDPAAMHNLGIAYSIGSGVNYSRSTALRWFSRAAKRGHQASIAAAQKIEAQIAEEKSALPEDLKYFSNQCTTLGFTPKTEKHGECVLDLVNSRTESLNRSEPVASRAETSKIESELTQIRLTQERIRLNQEYETREREVKEGTDAFVKLLKYKIDRNRR